MWQALREGLAKHIGEAIGALLLLLFGTLFWVTMPALVEPLWTRLQPQTLQRILGLSLLSVLVFLAYIIYLHRRLNTKLRVMFGMQWDRQGMAYCPACNKPLSAYGGRSWSEGGTVRYGFWCISCNREVPIHNDLGGYLTLVEARKILAESN